MISPGHGMNGSDQAVTVAIRPEDLVFDAVEGADGNSWMVRVEELEFLGSFVRATLAFGDAQHALSLLADVSINLVRHTNLAQGQEHRVALPAERIRVYPGHGVRE